jgi:hypothetical protein
MSRAFSDVRALAAVVMMITVAGCAEIVSSGPDEVQVDTGQFGELVPGTRQWISWLEANEHCSRFGRKPKLVDLRDSVAVYRCVPEE